MFPVFCQALQLPWLLLLDPPTFCPLRRDVIVHIACTGRKGLFCRYVCTTGFTLSNNCEGFLSSHPLSHFGFRVVLWFHKELSKHLLSNNRWGGFQTKTKRAEDFRVRISAKNTNIEKETKFQLDGSNKCVTWGTEAGSISPFPSTQKQQIAGFQHFWSENSYVGRWSDWGSRIFPTGVVLKTSTANKKPPNLLDADRSGHFVMGWNPCISWSVVYLATSLFETLLIDTSQVLQDWNADDTTPKKIGEKK